MNIHTFDTPTQPLKSIELSWDQFAAGDFPDTSHAQSLNGACVNAAQTMNHPPFNRPSDKLTKAVETTEQPWPFKDPRYVHSLKWTDSDGIEHMEVIRAMDRNEVNRRVAELKRLIRIARDKQPLDTRTPAGTNGHSEETPSLWCQPHNTPFAEYTNKKTGSKFWAHKDASGAWCRPPKA